MEIVASGPVTYSKHLPKLEGRIEWKVSEERALCGGLSGWAGSQSQLCNLVTLSSVCEMRPAGPTSWVVVSWGQTARKGVTRLSSQLFCAGPLIGGRGQGHKKLVRCP